MTLELNQVAPQVKAMGQSLAAQSPLRDEAVQSAQALLQQFSTNFTTLNHRLQLAEKVQPKLRFDWVGAAPTTEALGNNYPLPPSAERVTVIASDGSQILPNRHAITLYYLINIGSIVYRHGSNLKPETYNPKPLLYYTPEELLDEQGRLISPGEVNVKRDLAELKVLVDLAPVYTRDTTEPVVALMDGQLTLRVIDLPFDQQEKRQAEYINLLDKPRQSGALLAGYVDRPRSTFVLALLHLAKLEPADITEENLRQNPFRHLTDLELFAFLGPGERSAIFAVKGKNYDVYHRSGHAIHFFYLNVSHNQTTPHLARVEVPAWLATDPTAIDTLQATLVRQARLTGGYPYVLARADELAVISGEEREAVEMMLAVEMRRHGLIPEISLKQRNKNAFRFGRRKP
ncbi:MAG: DNA double-strand break repair nuclease NurA [Anaerolineae bacterium]|nr:DNA double-strand break repair nuclease NurA [Anaerolineae bacterium]